MKGTTAIAGMMGSGGGLDEVDEIAASVFEEDARDGAHIFGFAAEDDAERFETGVFGGDVAGEEGGGRNASGEESFLVGLGGRKAHGLKDEFDAFGAFRGCDSEPAELGAHGDVVFFYKAEDGGVEAESVILIFDHDAG